MTLTVRSSGAWIAVLLLGLLLACGGEEVAGPETASQDPTGELWPEQGPEPGFERAPGVPEPPPPPPDPEALHAARAEVARLGAVVAQAESDLEAANAALDVARERLASLRAAMPRWPDSQVFRNVQRRLLTDPALSHVAISAEVQDGTVTLRGVVPNERTRRVALRIAESVEGVMGVESELTLPE